MSESCRTWTIVRSSRGSGSSHRVAVPPGVPMKEKEVSRSGRRGRKPGRKGQMRALPESGQSTRKVADRCCESPSPPPHHRGGGGGGGGARKVANGGCPVSGEGRGSTRKVADGCCESPLPPSPLGPVMTCYCGTITNRNISK